MKKPAEACPSEPPDAAIWQIRDFDGSKLPVPGDTPKIAPGPLTETSCPDRANWPGCYENYAQSALDKSRMLCNILRHDRQDEQRTVWPAISMSEHAFATGNLTFKNSRS